MSNCWAKADVVVVVVVVAVVVTLIITKIIVISEKYRMHQQNLKPIHIWNVHFTTQDLMHEAKAAFVYLYSSYITAILDLQRSSVDVQ